jgi:hypothetical protein
MVPEPEAIVLESRGQEFTKELIAEIAKIQVPTILLGGDLELHDPIIAAHQWHHTLRRPFSIGQVAGLIHCLVRVPVRQNERIA